MYELHVEPLTRWYPKHKGRVENGTWQIQRVKVVKYVTPIDDDFYSEYGQITLVGNMVAMEKDGAVYKVKVEKVYNEKRGSYQYDVKYSQEVREFRTEFQQRSFLSMFLNDRQIDGLYALYQNPIQLLEEGNVEEIVKVKGIGEKTALKIIERYEACKDYGPAYGELGSFGLTVPFIQTLIKRYGSADTALDKVKNNPYILADDVKGVGFRKADEIAGNVGIGKHDIKRVVAYIQFYLNDLADSTGSSYTYYDTLLDGIDEFLGTDLPQEIIDEAMQTLIDKEILWYKDEETDDGDINTLIALRKIYECEKSIARHIRRLVNGDNNIDLDENKIDDLVRPQELKQGWDFTARQKEGIKAIIRNNVVIIRGYGGTGKSSTVAGVLSCLREDYSFRQCALSGKASVNLRDITGQDGSTIHSLLGYNPGTGVAYHEDNPLTTDMVILDEASMVDIFLFEKLIRAIPTGAKFILLGDTNQLESIGVGNILMDLIDSEIIPVITFDEIHRQGAKSGIIPFSIEIAKGKTRYKDNWVGQEILGELQDLTIIGYKYDKDSLEDRPSVDLIIENFKKLYKECRDISQIAVVVPTKANGTGCYKINQLIQNIVLPPRRRGDGIELGTKNQPFTIYRGDKVINLVNNYEVEPNIFNGNMGEVISIDKDNNKAIIDFYNIGEVELSGEDLKNLDLGYAITCHKSQGSTIPYLIYCLDYSHYVMLNRQQAYTGITRAKKKAIFIIETKAFNRAVRTSKISQKRNFLYHFLTGYLK